MGRHPIRENQLKLRLAETAARVMNESGLRDYQMAKQKAASILGISERRCWPSNQEIEQALLDYQRLFEADQSEERLRSLRQTALEAMRFLKDFQPRLVGSVLNGTTTKHTDVELHLFSEYPEMVSLYLEDQGIPFDEKEKRLRISGPEYQRYPVYRFIAKDQSIELTVFPLNGLRQAPLSPVDGKPMQRLSYAEATKLIQSY